MTTVIIGAGAIGCMMAVRLAAAKQAVTLVARPATAPRLAGQGVHLIEADGTVLSPDVHIVGSVAAALSAQPPVDLIVLAVKAYHTAATAAEIRQTAAMVPVLCLQNGVGNEETLAATLPGIPIVSGALTTPVAVVAPGRVQVARASYWLGLAPGPLATHLPPVAERFRQAGFQVQSWPQYAALKWSKLLMNLLANAQAAILGWSPAQLFAHPVSAGIEIMAWREAIRTMRGLGIRPLPLAHYPLPVATRLAQVLPVSLVRAMIGRFIVSGRGSKMPSLYYDLHPRPRSHSEITWLNGRVVDAARQLGQAAPCNATLTHIMEDLLQGHSEAAAWQGQPQKLWQAIQSHAYA
ncbi:MAG: ketopantoate reductase family protein [Chloroflexi bacterium]|nr:ketopantoate reductase family protein [Chloroflexota bacterium]